MKLSIITINYNNAAGLKKTLDSVAGQKLDFRLQMADRELENDDFQLEHVIVDGGSTDGSVDIIRDYVLQIANCGLQIEIKWVSEKDKGIYNAMNKGIKMAMGEYIQILNSGDVLASDHVITDCRLKIAELGYPEMIYGNMIKQTPDGKILGKSGKVAYSLLQYFTSTMNHDCCWIKRTLFVSDSVSERREKMCYGLYDERLKIVSDWKWFLQAIGLGELKPTYVDIDMTIFGTEGISEKNLSLRNQERRQVLEEVIPPAILWDYDHHAFDMVQMNRLRKYRLYGLVYLMERLLFKLEKWHILK